MDSNKLYTHNRLSDFVKNYKEYVNKIEKEESDPTSENFKYYHFNESPEGIRISNIGRFGRDIFLNNSSWKELPFSNGIDAWRMNLAKQYNRYKIAELQKFHSSNKKGLKFIMNRITDPVLVDARVLPNIDTTNLSYSITTKKDTTKEGIIDNFDNLQQKISELLLTTETGLDTMQDSELITIDFTGLVHIKPGNYKFTGQSENCTFYIWIGDQAICEYTTDNSTLKKGQTTYASYYSQEAYMPIRIQCYFSSKDKDIVNLNLAVIKEDTSHDTLVTTNITQEVLFNNHEVPLILYCAFVSDSNNDFLNDQFKCYGIFTIIDNEIVVENNDQLSLFYKTFKKNLNDVFNNKYDYNEDNRISYGVIPSINIEYTFVQKEIHPVPFCYSIYNINSDYRMGKTFQIKNKINSSGAYPMNQFSDKLTDSILEYSNSYREKPGYYPNKNSVDMQYFSKEQDVDGVRCKQLCNDNANCRYYFTYTSNNNPKCIINADNSTPFYNRIQPSNTQHPIDENSSSVFLRNYQLDISGGLNCGTFKNTNTRNEIINTNNYSDTFKYARYDISSNQIVEPTKIGICGDETFIKHQNDAKEILYENAKYFKNGSWKSKEGFQTNKKRKSKVTHAVSDTGDVIRNNLETQEEYGDKMEHINKKYNKLQDKLPKFNQLKNEMINNPKYDFKGDELLHFRTHLQPDVRKKKIIDNNQLYVNSQLLFTLGTVTTATLIVFAILLARD